MAAVRDAGGQPITVVIVDDHAAVRSLIRDQLAWGASGIEILDEGASGKEAIDLVGLARPNVLILDLGMPVMGGIEALPACKAASPATRIIVLTGGRAGEDCERALAAGADAFLRKPATLDLLVETVRRCARSDTERG